MNKAELIEVLTKELDTDRRSATEAVEHFVNAIVRAVHKGESVTITGFGVFERRRRAARVARNPRTGETVKVKPTSVPAFRPGAQFKAIVSGAQKVPSEGLAVKRGAGASATAAKKAPAKKATKAAAKKTAAKAPAKKVVAKKAATKAPAKKAVTKAPAKKVVAKKAATKAPAKKAVTKAPAKKVVAKKAATKAPAKKVVAKKAATKAVAKKAPAKKATKAPARKGRK
ncbi:DNA-binding protein [Mycolicibacter heraklionensis]|uniref:DNA-binding protein HupB n=1 Tax=Mycolicibacter heraklionensis TaxID=512402 RepID=A0A9X7WEX8_9MYCO|nr:HU family DNA-binding protein [Mycolicibacter heraklionensis]KLO28800.1 DNA-binding protein [Mycolicibacter heraklionensis]QZA06402.1 HU family DNA-binding protein [Mycolicibacter heraklionensis]